MNYKYFRIWTAFVYVVLAIIFVLMVSVIFARAMADEVGHRYDAKGAYNGSYRVTESGKIRLYDEKGNYEGSIVSKGDRLVRYNAKGEYEEEAEADDE
jgi:hypothetical protein